MYFSRLSRQSLGLILIVFVAAGPVNGDPAPKVVPKNRILRSCVWIVAAAALGEWGAEEFLNWTPAVGAAVAGLAMTGFRFRRARSVRSNLYKIESGLEKLNALIELVPSDLWIGDSAQNLTATCHQISATDLSKPRIIRSKWSTWLITDEGYDWLIKFTDAFYEISPLVHFATETDDVPLQKQFADYSLFVVTLALLGRDTRINERRDDALRAD
jgi:hypothetical protein